MAAPEAHPALVDVVDRALQLRLADRWPDARAMQIAVRKAYLEMYGATLPVAVPATHGHLSSAYDAALLEDSLERRAPPSVATTVLVVEPRSRHPWRAALAIALVLAGLALAGAKSYRQTAQGAERANVTLVEVAASPFSPPQAASSPTPVRTTLPEPGSAPPLASSAAPALRVHRPSVYDRRY